MAGKMKNPILFSNIRDVLINSAKKYPDKPAFIIKNPGGKYENKSFAEFLNDVNAFSRAMTERGYTTDSRVAVIGRNRYEWAVAYCGLLCAGIVSVPLDKDLKDNELGMSLRRSKATAVIFDEKYTDKITRVFESGETSLKECICMSPSDEFTSVQDIVSDGRKISTPVPNPDPDKMSVLLFTSGTTDIAKAVMLNQRGIARNIYDMQIVEDICYEDVSMAILPFHHIFGSTGLLVMLACGATTVFTDGLRYIAKNLVEYKVSVFVGVPALCDGIYKNVTKKLASVGKLKMFEKLVSVSNALRKVGIDLRSVMFRQLRNALGGKMRLIISGGAPLSKETSAFFNNAGIVLVQGYGLTETSPVIAAEAPGALRIGSVGKPMSGVNVSIVRPDSDGIGEIHVSGDNVMLGYYENDSANAAAFENGKFITGDLGYLDKDGYLFITGRKKDMIVLKNGKKVFPEELEILINRIDGVSESFVYGEGSDGLGCDKVVCRVVYDSKFFDKPEQEIKQILWNNIKEINDTLPIYKHIKGITVTTKPLIKTSTNKIKRAENMKEI